MIIRKERSMLYKIFPIYSTSLKFVPTYNTLSEKEFGNIIRYITTSLKGIRIEYTIRSIVCR